MSRGLGSRQRHILDRLELGGDPGLGAWFEECGYVSVRTLASLDPEPTRSELVSTRRAIQKLAANGRIEVRGRRERMVRLPVSDEQRGAEELEILRRRREHRASLSVA